MPFEAYVGAEFCTGSTDEEPLDAFLDDVIESFETGMGEDIVVFADLKVVAIIRDTTTGLDVLLFPDAIDDERSRNSLIHRYPSRR